MVLQNWGYKLLLNLFHIFWGHKYLQTSPLRSFWYHIMPSKMTPKCKKRKTIYRKVSIRSRILVYKKYILLQATNNIPEFQAKKHNNSMEGVTRYTETDAMNDLVYCNHKTSSATNVSQEQLKLVCHLVPKQIGKVFK